MALCHPRLVEQDSLLQVLLDMLRKVLERVLEVLKTVPSNDVHNSMLIAESKVSWMILSLHSQMLWCGHSGECERACACVCARMHFF